MWTLKLLWLSPKQDVGRDIPGIHRSRFSPVIDLSSGFARCAVAILLCLLAPIALASEHTAVGMKTNADGSASISIGAPHAFASVFLDGDVYNSDYRLEIAAEDRGQLASIFMAGTFNGDWHLKSASGWHAWDPDTEQLTPFAEAVLTEVVAIEAFTNSYLTAGDYVIYAAYQIAGQDLVVAASPLSFEVQAANADSLHRFASDAAMEAYLKQGLETSASDQAYAVLEASTVDAVADSDGSAAADRVSTTNLQEGDVDEADTIKTDGSHLFMLRNCAGKTCLVTYELDAEAATASELSSLELATTQTVDGLYLVQDRAQGSDLLVTVGGRNSYNSRWLDVWYWASNETHLEFLDASDPAALVSLETLSIEGQLIASRRIGDLLYLVTRYTPYLAGYETYAYSEESRQNNAELLTGITLDDLLPKVTDSRQQVSNLISSSDCYLPTRSLDVNSDPSIITVTAIPLAAPGERQSTCFLGDSESLYMTAESLYLATTQYNYQIFSTAALVYDPEHTTAIHKFALVDGGIEYRGSGQVRGHLGWAEDKKSFRMGENGDYLNIVTSVGDTWSQTSSTRLTVLKESSQGNELQVVDVIDGIGKPGERLYAARFLGNRAYLVTFRLTDPLYVIDLSDQENPVIAGSLEIEGYSDYLHPISESLLLGIGKDAIFDDTSTDFGGGRGAWYQGLKLSLFDVSDPANPSQVAALVLGKRGTSSAVLSDHHALSFLPANGTEPARLAIPVDLNDTVPSWANFDPELPNAYYDYTHTGLYSFEIDAEGITQAGIIFGTQSGSNLFYGNYTDRSILLNDAVFYIHQGEVLSSYWGEQ